MYIRSFHIDGFGIYANITVENLAPGLTIFLGENEAGKSTCMEFLRTMLTGYPHPNSREAKSLPGPLHTSQAGGSMLLHTNECGLLRLTRRPGNNGGLLTLTDADGNPLDQEKLRQVLFGVSRDVYRKVFGFSLTELEDLNSLTGEGVRNALYGASFGPGLRAPGDALAMLRKKADEIFKSGGSKPPLNAVLHELNELRQRKAELEQAGAGFDALAQELGNRREELTHLRTHRLELEEERRLLERRLGVWQQWNEWRLANTRLERLAPMSASFPEDGKARLAQAMEAREGCERHRAALKEKLTRLKERRDAIRPDVSLLEALPELRRLSERKSGFRQALASQSADEDALCRAGEDVRRELARLGPNWTCERIRSTDRSLFAREDLERLAREMDAATSAHQAAVDALNLCNRDVENAEREVASVEAALSLLPEPVAELDGDTRDDLRQLLARQEEARRQRPLREHAVQEARTTFARAYNPLRLATAVKVDEHADSLLDTLLEHQEDALELAGAVQKQMHEADAAAQDVRQAEDQVAAVKVRMDTLRKEQRLEGLSRNELDTQAAALRKLRALSSTLETEQERLKELTTRIDSEPPMKRIRSLPLLLLGILTVLVGAGMLLAVWQMGPLTISLAEWFQMPGLQLPVDLWSGYLLLLCGVGFLAGALPHNGQETKRRKQELEQLLSRRDACALHVAELHEQSSKLCAEANVESMDLITIEAREALLEHEREQCFQEERTRKDMNDLKQALDEARTETARLQAARSEAESVVQQIRRRWHEFMLGLHVSNVPSPEGAAAFFARVESARLAYSAVATAEAELHALDEDIATTEERMRSVPAVSERMHDTYDAEALKQAARQVLESCREADAAREQRIKTEASLQNAKNELRRAGTRQCEMNEELRQSHDRLETSQTQWQEALRSLGLGEGLAPETVREAFKYMDACLAAEAALDQARTRMSQTRAELTALRDPLDALLSRLGRQPMTDTDGRPDWLVSLDTALADAEKASDALSRRESMENAFTEAEDEWRAAEAELESARAAEASLLSVAGAADAEDFLRQAALHEERDSLTRRIQDLEDALRLAAGKTPWQEFLATFEGTDRETQERRCAAIGEELSDLRDREETLVQRTSELGGRMDTLTQSDELSQLLQREAALLDSIERMAFDWSRLALAHDILEHAKHSFERERQPEVIRQASRIFASITGRRWQGINAKLEDSSLAILPAQGEPVKPENLSRGTREQAYLALRLAYIADHASHANPLPIIMDEVLVNFDPQRAERTARAFVELTDSGKNEAHQLFYFTCQPHIVELLRKAEPHAALFIVENGAIKAA